MKKLTNLKGAKALSKNEQKAIKGGAESRFFCCNSDPRCPQNDSLGCTFVWGQCEDFGGPNC